MPCDDSTAIFILFEWWQVELDCYGRVGGGVGEGGCLVVSRLFSNLCKDFMDGSKYVSQWNNDTLLFWNICSTKTFEDVAYCEILIFMIEVSNTPLSHYLK